MNYSLATLPDKEIKEELENCELTGFEKDLRYQPLHCASCGSYNTRSRQLYNNAEIPLVLCDKCIAEFIIGEK